MGTRYTFKCNKCGYDVESTGDLDYGFHAVLRPYICNDCNIVTDAIVGIQKNGLKTPEEMRYLNLFLKRKMTFILVKSVMGKI